MEAPITNDFSGSELPRDLSERGLFSVMSRLDQDQADAHQAVGRHDGEGDAPYALSVRAVRSVDLPALMRSPDFISLNEPSVAPDAYSPLGAALRALAPGRARPKFFVARSNGRLVGFAHFQQMGSDHRWQAEAMGAATGVYGSGPVWEELLRHATVAAGLRGVKRLYAKAPSALSLLESFNRANFSAYATETIFLARHPIVDDFEPSLRRQEPSDGWAIHQLYNAATPRQVQYAEAFTSDRWAIPRSNRHERVMGWLIEEGNIVSGSVRLTSVGGDHRIELLYHPERVPVVHDLILTVLDELRKAAKIDRICCAVRGYQAEAATALERRGFEPVMEQDLLIKYTTATARVAQLEGVPFPVELIERLPKRAPSFPYGASIGDQGR